MNPTKKQITLALSGAVLICGVTWSTVSSASVSRPLAADNHTNTAYTATAQEQGAVSQESLPASSVAYALEASEENDAAAWKARFKIYEPFGLTYDTSKDELRYHGRLVRCFEDYYPLDDTGEMAAGTDFFQENGVTDVYAVRDLGHIKVNADGSYDPSGKLVGLREADKEEFAARDVKAFQNPADTEAAAVSEGSVSVEEMLELAAEYQPFGVTYDPDTERWFFHGERVRRFDDTLLSNGETPGSGKFSGSLRSFFDKDGSVDIYTVRDYTKLNDDGYGTLTEVKKVE